MYIIIIGRLYIDIWYSQRLQVIVSQSQKHEHVRWPLCSTMTLPWWYPHQSLKKYRHLQLSSFLSSAAFGSADHHHQISSRPLPAQQTPDSYKARTLETRISTQMISNDLVACIPETLAGPKTLGKLASIPSDFCSEHKRALWICWGDLYIYIYYIRKYSFLL